MKREIEFLPIQTFVFDTPDEAMETVAREFANWIRTLRFRREDAILAFDSGRLMENFYDKVTGMSGIEEKGGLPLSGVRSFQVMEVAGRASDAEGSVRFEHQSKLFERWKVPGDQQHFPDGAALASDPAGTCGAYEESFLQKGPPNLSLIGLGANGRIGINEAGSEYDCRTRCAELGDDSLAELSAAHDGLSFANPVAGVGLATLRASQRIRIFAFGADKAAAVEDGMLPDFEAPYPLSAFAGHKDVQLLLDNAAADRLE